ncbi:MAG: transcription termination/antitermination protein NusA [Clostridiales bacterium]|nr:transcription termination/antitermination protein NusA [Clostridiales bacterium]
MKNKKNNNEELINALDTLEKEKNISKEVLLETIENSLLAACKNEFDRTDNIRVNIDREKGSIAVYAAKEVVEEVEDPSIQISIIEAKEKFPSTEIGDIVNVEVTPKNFGRIAAQKAKQVVVQKIREEERKIQYEHYYGKERDIVTGIVQRYVGKNISVNLGKVDAMLNENEQVKTEHFKSNERIKLYILEVKNTTKGPRIILSRTHPELVKRLFEAEVTEVREGIVEIKSIAREAGSRTKMAVYSNDPDVDPVGACVGVNGTRVNTIVEELRGEKIDIINWSDNPAILIENALSPAKVVSVIADEEEKSAKVVVPDYQLSLAIGKEGQNARLAARLTGYRIDIKSETQYREEELAKLEEELKEINFDGDYESDDEYNLNESYEDFSSDDEYGYDESDDELDYNYDDSEYDYEESDEDSYSDDDYDYDEEDQSYSDDDSYNEDDYYDESEDDSYYDDEYDYDEDDDDSQY